MLPIFSLFERTIFLLTSQRGSLFFMPGLISMYRSRTSSEYSSWQEKQLNNVKHFSFYQKFACTSFKQNQIKPKQKNQKKKEKKNKNKNKTKWKKQNRKQKTENKAVHLLSMRFTAACYRLSILIPCRYVTFE